MQDVDNYYKCFNDIKNLNVLTLDLERQEFNVSATKIRNNPFQYWEYIPLRERSFFSIKIGIFLMIRLKQDSLWKNFLIITIHMHMTMKNF